MQVGDFWTKTFDILGSIYAVTLRGRPLRLAAVSTLQATDCRGRPSILLMHGGEMGADNCTQDSTEANEQDGSVCVSLCLARGWQHC